MKVLMIGPHQEKVLGGMSSVLKNYYKSDLINKVNVKAIATVVDGKKIVKGAYFISAYIKVLFYVMFVNVDILHIHVASRNSFFRKAYFVKLGKRFNKKVIMHMHGAEFDDFYWKECNDYKRSYISDILNSCDLIIALGSQWKKKINRYCSTEVVVLHNAIEVPNKNNYNIQSKNIVLLGRLEKRKGTYDVLEIVKDIINKDNGIKFIFAGDGNLERLDKKIKEKDIGTYVNVLGWINVEEREKLLKDTMIYMLPSYNEGLPMSILEAMGYGIPVISTFVGSIPDVIEQGKNGYLIKPGNTAELSKYIEVLLTDLQLRKTISYNNYKKSREEYDICIHIEKLIIIYNNLLINKI